MTKRLWLIIPVILTFIPVLLVPISAENQFVDFDFACEIASVSSPVNIVDWAPGLYACGYTSSSNRLTGSFAPYKSNGFSNPYGGFYSDDGVSLKASSGAVSRLNANMGRVAFTCNNEQFYQWLVDHGYGSYCDVHYRFVLDYFPTDVLSYFFYNFFVNKYILWCCGIWVLAISFKLIFSRSGVRACTSGF